MPENYVHGVPQYLCHGHADPRRRHSAGGQVAMTAGPTKVEGNALHPDSNGGTDRFAQASILNLYDPDRATRFLKDGSDCNAGSGAGFAGRPFAAVCRPTAARRLAFLLERNNSPSRRRLQKAIGQKLAAGALVRV